MKYILWDLEINILGSSQIARGTAEKNSVE
jgi:hypothetical protein